MASTRSKKSNITFEKPPAKFEETATAKIRGKNFSLFENETLLKSCDKFHSVINKNSNRAVDIKKKEMAWKLIKTEFDLLCKANGNFVSFY